MELDPRGGGIAARERVMHLRETVRPVGIFRGGIPQGTKRFHRRADLAPRHEDVDIRRRAQARIAVDPLGERRSLDRQRRNTGRLQSVDDPPQGRVKHQRAQARVPARALNTRPDHVVHSFGGQLDRPRAEQGKEPPLGEYLGVGTDVDTAEQLHQPRTRRLARFGGRSQPHRQLCLDGVHARLAV